MQKLHAVLLTITAISSIILISLVVLAPDHSGELRTDLVVGDYYTIRSSIPTTPTVDTTYTIVDIDDGRNYIVEIKTDEQQETTTMSKEEYLKNIRLDDSGLYINRDARAIIETEFGQRTCNLYSSDLNRYWVDKHNIIYQSFVGGSSSELVATSLIIE